MAYKLVWLPEVLRGAGLRVIECGGWQTRGHGDVGSTFGIICHHTAGALPSAGSFPSLGIVRDGRPGLRGPLAQLGLGREGEWYVIAAGKAWHAGPGKFKGIDAGNHHFIGIEAENTGYTTGPRAEPWSEAMLDSYARGCAAILKRHNRLTDWCIGHKEWALPKGRKIDPTFDMVAFRERITAIRREVPAYTATKPPHPNAEKMITVMMLDGYSPVQAFGWTANAQQESYEDLRTTVVGDAGAALGIFQWQKTRQQEMYKFAEQRGKPWNDLETQVVFSLNEPGERRALDLLRRATTIEEAVDAGLAYTRPGKPHRARRIALAKALEAWYEAKAKEAQA